jgi:hypothetical protein
MRPLSFRSSLIVALGAVAAAACGNISLSSMSAAGGFSPAPTGLNDIDAATDGGPEGLVMPGDAGLAPAITGNPLCNYSNVDTIANACEPDYPAHASGVKGLGCSVTDAGIVEETPADAGAQNEDGGGVGGSYDAAAPSIDAGASTGPACHVVQEGAADGGSWKTQVCTAAGTGTDGDQCQSSTDCAVTYECVGTPGQCRRYCCEGNSVCSTTNAQSFCDVQPVVSGKFDVPVCMPVSGCSLFGTCPSNQTCAVVEDDGTTSCVNVGSAKVGDPCDEVHCAAGLTCLGNAGSRTCFQLCHVDSTTECPPSTTCSGSAQLFKDPQFGICQ